MSGEREPETRPHVEPEPEPEPRPDLELEPKLKVRRLNRLAVLLVAAVGILVLWAAYFVLSTRTPIGAGSGEPRQPALEADRPAIDQLERRARRRPERTEGPLSWPQARPASPTLALPQPAPEPPPTSRRASEEELRLRRAYDAPVLVADFERGSLSATRELPRDLPRDLPRELGAGLGQGGVTGPGRPALDGRTASERDPNLLAEKEEFLRRARERGPTSVLESPLEAPGSPFEIREGTLIPAILSAGINSDLPGQTRALVRQNVYDTVTGRYLLIPQGSRLIGSYDHRVAWGQKRVLLAWHRLDFPDGRSLDLAGMPGADLAAMAGIRDRVNNHFVRTFGSALMLSAISAGVQLSQPQESSLGAAPSARQITAAALGQELGRAMGEITRRNVNIQPTLEIRPGVLFNIEVTADLVLPGPYRREAQTERR